MEGDYVVNVIVDVGYVWGNCIDNVGSWIIVENIIVWLIDFYFYIEFVIGGSYVIDEKIEWYCVVLVIMLCMEGSVCLWFCS